MKEDALKSFRESKGWEAGVDGNVAIVTVGGGDHVTTGNVKEPISGFGYDVKGLKGDISARISPIRSAPIGVRLAGFNTKGQPAAIAGATL